MITRKLYNLLTFIKRPLSNPKLLQSYVGSGIAITNVVVVQLNKLLKHMLVIQGIDPNTQPSLLLKKTFQQELEDCFCGIKKDYDKDFDHSFETKKFNRFCNKVKHVDLTIEGFMRRAGVGNLKGTHSSLSSIMEKSPIDELDELCRSSFFNTPIEFKDKDKDKDVEKKNNRSQNIEEFLENELDCLFDKNGAIRKSLQQISEIAESMEGRQEGENLEPEEISKLMQRTNELKNIKKEIEEYNQAEMAKVKKPIQQRESNGRFKSSFSRSSK